MSQPERTSTRVVWVMNSFDRGGAENGLLALIRDGVFAEVELSIVALVRGRGTLEGTLRDLGHVPSILLDRERMRLRDLPMLLVALYRLIRGVAPHVVVGSLPQANLLARLSLLFDRSTVYASFEHNTHLAKKAYETGFRWTSWRVDWMLSDSPSTLRIAGERLYRTLPVRRCVVPLVSFATPATRQPRARSASDAFALVNAARFTDVKNQQSILHALASLVADGRAVHLTLYGDGPQRQSCERLAAQLQIGKYVTFAGYCSDWASRPADLFVLSSRHEGLCIVALEAMHAGVPVLAPRVGGLNDYSPACFAATLAGVAPEQIANGIRQVMDRPEHAAASTQMAGEMLDNRYGGMAVTQICRDLNAALRAVACTPATGRMSAPEVSTT